MSFGHPVSTNYKLLKSVGPCVADTGVVSNGRLDDMEDALGMLHKHNLTQTKLFVDVYWRQQWDNLSWDVCGRSWVQQGDVEYLVELDRCW